MTPSLKVRERLISIEALEDLAMVADEVAAILNLLSFGIQGVDNPLPDALRGAARLAAAMRSTLNQLTQDTGDEN